MDASVSFVLESLTHLRTYQADLIYGAEVEVKKLERKLELLKSILKDASKKSKKEEAFKEWEKQIRKVIYEVEDTIDAYITRNRGINAVAKPLILNLAQRVQMLLEGPVREVFDRAKTHFATLSITGLTQESEGQEIQCPSKVPKKSHIVGLEDETQSIINHLCEHSEKLKVISIVGMPGLGKTTLAWKIFEHRNILHEFPVQIWVTVSATLNRKDVFLTILKRFTHQELSMKSDDELASMVMERLDRQKFLIILDNVWTLEAWDQIKAALPMENGMGKVLITTCMGYVAWHAMAAQAPHKLRFLNEKESWELLQYEVYGALNAFDKDLVKVGKVIAKNCHGLPLSIVLIAGIMLDKIETARGSNRFIRKEWDRLSVNIEDRLISEDRESRMLKTIAVSYSKLPDDLRNCFLYLGMFPKGALIPTWQLTRLWIAEGFIQPKPGYSLEEIALDNLKDLISRSLVMVQETKLDGEVKTCCVHEVILSFCKDEAASGKDLQEIRMNEKEGVFEPLLQNMKEIRLLSIHSCVHEFFSKKPEIPTRSFLCFPNESIHLDPKDIAPVIKAFSLLRVFAAEEIKFREFPLKVTSLIHLRYLTLSVAYKLEVLPDAICNLWSLQTLIVETLSSTLEIKADIWKMIKLRHFKTKASVTLTCKDRTGDQGGENLKTFGRLSSESCTDDVFNKAKNLKELAIRGELSKLLLDSECLKKLNILNKLKLEHEYSCESPNPLRSLPEPGRFPQNLLILTLTSTYLTWTQMTTLGKLGHLEVLKLKKSAFVGDSWDVTDNGFRNLEFLFIEHTDLVFWTAPNHAFPKLKGLTLINCEALEEVPSVLGETLEILSLERVTPSAVSSAKKIEQLAKQKELKAKRRGIKLVIGATIFQV